MLAHLCRTPWYVVLGCLCLVGCNEDPAAPVQDTSSVGLVQSAAAMVRDANTGAVVLRAFGSRADGASLSHPNQADQWTFLADQPDNANEDQCWTVTYDGAWSLTEDTREILGVVYADLGQVTMGVTAAWDLVVAAGRDRPFANWALVQTTADGVEAPFFVFQMDGAGLVFVDTESGVVR